jgi:hypothetical protein
MRCPNCGCEYQLGARFCPACGARLSVAAGPAAVPPIKAVCPACGLENAAGVKYCKSCGAAIAGRGVPPAKPPARAAATSRTGGASSFGADVTPGVKGLRAVSPALFAIILICFLFPFVDISCSGDQVASFDGFDLIFGKSVQGSEYRAGDVSFAAALAFFFALTGFVAGLALSLRKSKVGRLPGIPAVMGAVGFVALLALKATLDDNIAHQEYGHLFQTHYRGGYKTAWAVFLLAAAWNVVLAVVPEGKLKEWTRTFGGGASP